MDSQGKHKGKKPLPDDDPWAPFYEALKRLETTIDRLRIKKDEERNAVCTGENGKAEKESFDSLSVDNHFYISNSDFDKGKQTSSACSLPQSFEHSEEWRDEDYEVEDFAICVDDPWDDNEYPRTSLPEAQETSRIAFQLVGDPYHPVPAPRHLLTRDIPSSSISVFPDASRTPPCSRQYFQIIGIPWYSLLPVPIISCYVISNIPSFPLPSLQALADLRMLKPDLEQIEAGIESMDSLTVSPVGEAELDARGYDIHHIQQEEYRQPDDIMTVNDEGEEVFYPNLEAFSNAEDFGAEIIDQEGVFLVDEFQDFPENCDAPKTESQIEEWEGDLDDFDLDVRESPFEALAGGTYWVPLEEEGDEAESNNVARALDRALYIAELLLDLHSEKQLVQAVAWLESFLRERAHYKTFSALVDLALGGLSFDELKKVIELREYCQEAGLSGWRYFDVMSKSWEVRRVTPTYAQMLQIVRARRDFPVEDMIDHHWYDLWLHLRKGNPGFDNFIHFVLLLLEKGRTDPLSIPLQETSEEIADRYSWPKLCRVKGVSDAWLVHLLPRAEPGHLLSHIPPRPKNDD